MFRVKSVIRLERNSMSDNFMRYDKLKDNCLRISFNKLKSKIFLFLSSLQF